MCWWWPRKRAGGLVLPRGGQHLGAARSETAPVVSLFLEVVDVFGMRSEFVVDVMLPRQTSQSQQDNASAGS